MSSPVTASVDVPSAWKARLLSHLDRYKQYPIAARAKGLEGITLLSFGIDRQGRVLGYHLVRSSGSAELDGEAFAMIVRASPLPPAPAELGAQVVQLVVPVRFRM
jgi:protein TonB